MNDDENRKMMNELFASEAGVRVAVHDLLCALDAHLDEYKKVRQVVGDQLVPRLNGLIYWGFVPGARVEHNGVRYRFDGFTNDMRLAFRALNENGEASAETTFSSVRDVDEHLDEFKKVEK